jgi:hypothetical protein
MAGGLNFFAVRGRGPRRSCDHSKNPLQAAAGILRSCRSTTELRPHFPILSVRIAVTAGAPRPAGREYMSILSRCLDGVHSAQRFGDA